MKKETERGKTSTKEKRPSERRVKVSERGAASFAVPRAELQAVGDEYSALVLR